MLRSMACAVRASVMRARTHRVPPPGQDQTSLANVRFCRVAQSRRGLLGRLSCDGGGAGEHLLDGANGRGLADGKITPVDVKLALRKASAERVGGLEEEAASPPQEQVPSVSPNVRLNGMLA